MKVLVTALFVFGLTFAASIEDGGPRMPHSLYNDVPDEEKQESLKSVECTLCKAVMNLLDDNLKDNRTSEAIAHALEDVCTFLGPFAANCQQFVDDNIQKIIDFLIQRTDPDKACESLRLCLEIVKNKRDLECDLCKGVIGFVDSFLTENRTEQEVENVLETICSKFPDTISDECKHFVEDNYPTIVQLLVDRIQPDDVCNALGLCNKDKGRRNMMLCKNDSDCTAQFHCPYGDMCIHESGKTEGSCACRLPGFVGRRSVGLMSCMNDSDCSAQFNCPYGEVCIHNNGMSLGSCACRLPGVGRRNVDSSHSDSFARVARTSCLWDYNCQGHACPAGYYPYCPSDHGLAASTCSCKRHHV